MCTYNQSWYRYILSYYVFGLREAFIVWMFFFIQMEDREHSTTTQLPATHHGAHEVRYTVLSAAAVRIWCSGSRHLCLIQCFVCESNKTHLYRTGTSRQRIFSLSSWYGSA
jgi:hypothetical protein